MSTPFFSIITPTFNRVNDGKLKRCLNSVLTQTFEDFEHITVDDGSASGEDSKGLVESFEDERFKYIRIERSQRVVARNTGMRAAAGQNICWLDDDDCYNPMYLATFAHHIRKFPEAKLFVAGVVVHGIERDREGNQTVPKWTRIRSAWMPPGDPEGKHPHGIFNSGKVGSGMFVFARSCLADIGLMPNSWNHWEPIADGMDEWVGVPSGTTGYSAAKKLVGNPWGDDHAMFQRLCRFYKVHLIEAALYIQFRK